MSLPLAPAFLRTSRWRKPITVALFVLVALAPIAFWISATRPAKTESSFHLVRRGDFLISIVEGGTIEAVNEDLIRSDVEGTARIIFIVPEGSSVKRGDLLVELDSATSQDAVNQQQIVVEKAQFTLIQAEQQLEIQKSIVDSEIDAASLKVEFAQSDLDKHAKGEAQQTRRNAQIEITNVLETLQIAQERLDWTERLHKQGFETKANVDKDRLAVSQSTLKLEQTRQALWMIETFDIPKKRRELEAAHQEAGENLERVKRQADSKLAQYKADVATQKSTLELSRNKLARDLKQLQATKIHAPQDGLVVYGGSGDRRFSSESLIEEGAVIRNRQEIIKLPDISEMKLTVKIHESHVNQVQPGQPAYVVLDALPDHRFRGYVNRVAPLPDSSSRWGNPNLKVYPTEIRIIDPMPNVKPGVSARAEVIVTNLQNVLTVPIQAVTTRKGQQVVFLASAPNQPVPVSIGMYNIKLIEILSGLHEGDPVLLSPPSDSDERDLAGTIIAEGDVLPGPPTNVAASFTRRAQPDPRKRGGALREPAAGGPGPRVERTPNASGPTAAPEERRRDRAAPSGDPTGADNATRRRGDGGGTGSGTGFNREAMLKQFDANADGQLDEVERAAMRARFGGGARGPTNGAPATGSGQAPTQAPGLLDASR